MTNEFLKRLIEEGSTEKALRLVVRKRREDPDDPVLAAFQGVCQADLGDYPQAIEVLEPALEKIPGFFVAHAHLICCLARIGRITDAERRARALLLNPAVDARSLLKAAEPLTHKRTGLARLLAKAAVGRAPKDSLCWLAWSFILSTTGRPRAAQAALDHALALDPDNHVLRQTAFWLALDRDDPALALEHARRVSPGLFTSPFEVSTILDLAREHVPAADPFVAGLKRRLRSLRRSKSGQAQALLDSVTLGAL